MQRILWLPFHNFFQKQYEKVKNMALYPVDFLDPGMNLAALFTREMRPEKSRSAFSLTTKSQLNMN